VGSSRHDLHGSTLQLDYAIIEAELWDRDYRSPPPP
jgi:hypothetical protein